MLTNKENLMKYDIERLNNIPIMDVLESLGAISGKNKRIIHCLHRHD